MRLCYPLYWLCAISVRCKRVWHESVEATGLAGQLAALNLHWTANPNTGDNKVLVHESVTLLGAEERKHIIETCLA
jgi:hypothetical protein